MRYTRGHRRSILSLAFYSAIIGTVSGTLVSVFNLIAHFLIEKRATLTNYLTDNFWFVVAFFVILILGSVIMYFIHHFSPDSKGSGIPYAEGVVRGILPFNWIKTGIAMFFGSMISFFSGLALGTEGPSILLGTISAKGAAKVTKAPKSLDRTLLTSGAACGMAVAFNAPCAGIIFALEETHHRFTPMLLVSAFISVTFAVVARQLILGNEILFSGINLINIPIKYFYFLCLAGALAGVLAKLYNTLIFALKKLIKGKTITFFVLLVTFIIAGILTFVLPMANGDGKEIMHALSTVKMTLGYLAVVLVVRMVFSILCGVSGASGGMFMPMLAIGAVLGGLVGQICSYIGLPVEYIPTIMIGTMLAFFSSSVHAPISALVLSIELTQTAVGFFPIAVIVGASYLVAVLLRSNPLYEELLQRLRTINQKPEILNVTLTITEYAYVCGKQIRDVLWPANCLVKTIERNDNFIIPDGETQLEAGDILTIEAEQNKGTDVIEALKGLLAN